MGFMSWYDLIKWYSQNTKNEENRYEKIGDKGVAYFTYILYTQAKISKEVGTLSGDLKELIKEVFDLGNSYWMARLLKEFQFDIKFK